MDISGKPDEQLARATRLAEIADRCDALEAQFLKSKEADDAGVTAHKKLESAASMFRSAKSFAGMDLLGGGLLAGALKYSQLGKARTQLHRADRALRVFSSKLATINIGGVAGPTIGGSLKVADVLFDNPVSDWMVQGRITGARSRVRRTQSKVYEIVIELREHRKEIAAELATLEAERDRLLDTQG